MSTSKSLNVHLPARLLSLTNTHISFCYYIISFDPFSNFMPQIVAKSRYYRLVHFLVALSDRILQRKKFVAKSERGKSQLASENSQNLSTQRQCCSVRYKQESELAIRRGGDSFRPAATLTIHYQAQFTCRYIAWAFHDGVTGSPLTRMNMRDVILSSWISHQIWT